MQKKKKTVKSNCNAEKQEKGSDKSEDQCTSVYAYHNEDCRSASMMFEVCLRILVYAVRVCECVCIV